MSEWFDLNEMSVINLSSLIQVKPTTDVVFNKIFIIQQNLLQHAQLSTCVVHHLPTF